MPKQDIFDSGQAKKATLNLEKGHPFLPKIFAKEKRSFLHRALSLRPQPTP